MTNDKQLDYLIGLLYETALDPNLWTEALGLCVQYAGGIDGQLLSLDKKHNTPIATGSMMAKTKYSQPIAACEYLDYYLSIDPRFKMVQGGAIDEWLCCHHTLDQDFVDHNEFFQDFYIYRGLRYAMMAWIQDNKDDHTLLAVVRGVGQPAFENTEQLAAKRFSGHLQRALRLQKYTQNLCTKAELGARAIDAMALAMLIVDSKCTILHLNTGAEQLLNNQYSGLVASNGHLSCTHPTTHGRLRTLVAGATDYSAVGGAMFLNGTENRQIIVVPLPAASPFAQDWQTPLALILVIEASNNLPTLKYLAHLYNLSPAELRVAEALVAGKSPENYATEAAVSMNTVRSQLKNLFNKTGTHRQSELVALLSRAPSLQS
jgi:DNA-binding CsgD family transcriptional regulator